MTKVALLVACLATLAGIWWKFRNVDKELAKLQRDVSDDLDALDAAIDELEAAIDELDEDGEERRPCLH